MWGTSKYGVTQTALCYQETKTDTERAHFYCCSLNGLAFAFITQETICEIKQKLQRWYSSSVSQRSKCISLSDKKRDLLKNVWKEQCEPGVLRLTKYEITKKMSNEKL